MEISQNLTWKGRSSMSMRFYEDYFSYVGVSESPKIYHRWCAISMVAAVLGRNVFLPFGHGTIYPNMYILITGTPGARKGSALNVAKNLLSALGYKKLAPQRLSPERFLAELQSLNRAEVQEIEEIEVEELTFDEPSEIYVMSDEYGDFIKGNLDFIRLLTNLWDNLGEYKHPKLHGKSVYIHEPTVNIIGATTPQDMAITLPIEAIGQGALSRYILVHADPTGIKISWPELPDPFKKQQMVERLQGIQKNVVGKTEFTEGATILLEELYKNTPPLDDPRFLYYNTRRQTHLMKTSVIMAAMDGTTKVGTRHLLEANTLLYATESRMSKALGEFGKAKNADIANAIMEKLRSASRPQSLKQIWKYVAQDLNKMDDLVDLMKSLQQAEKVQYIKGREPGFLPLHSHVNGWKKEFLIEDDFLLPEERA